MAIDLCDRKTKRNTDEFTKAEHSSEKMLVYLNRLEKPVNDKI
jgi:hypothetical protein